MDYASDDHHCLSNAQTLNVKAGKEAHTLAAAHGQSLGGYRFYGGQTFPPLIRSTKTKQKEDFEFCFSFFQSYSKEPFGSLPNQLIYPQGETLNAVGFFFPFSVSECCRVSHKKKKKTIV